MEVRRIEMKGSYTTNTLLFNPAVCNGCGMCEAVCPHAVFAIKDRSVRVVRPEACMECGACQLNCHLGAIQVESGVGCATAMIFAALLRKKEATCGGARAPLS